MNRLIATLVLFILTVQISFAQSKKPVFERQNNLVKATYFYDNGAIKEVGYFKNDKLHSQWISYNEEGKVKVTARYKNGKKHGKWYFVGDDTVKEVNYKSNKIIKVKDVEELDTSLI